jgi:hypothetical protein
VAYRFTATYLGKAPHIKVMVQTVEQARALKAESALEALDRGYKVDTITPYDAMPIVDVLRHPLGRPRLELKIAEVS